MAFIFLYFLSFQVASPPCVRVLFVWAKRVWDFGSYLRLMGWRSFMQTLKWAFSLQGLDGYFTRRFNGILRND